ATCAERGEVFAAPAVRIPAVAAGHPLSMPSLPTMCVHASALASQLRVMASSFMFDASVRARHVLEDRLLLAQPVGGHFAPGPDALDRRVHQLQHPETRPIVQPDV